MKKMSSDRLASLCFLAGALASPDGVTLIISPSGMQVYTPVELFDIDIEAVIAELRKIHGNDRVTVHRFVGEFGYKPRRDHA